jgi:hypothetical protein
VSGISVSTNTTVTYNPAVTDRRFTLALGGSNTSTTTQTTTSVTNFGSAPATTSTESTTVTYVTQETITIPAGTFVACRFTVVTSSGGTNEEWFGKGNGAPLQLTSKASDGTSILLSLTAASRLNGAPL